MLQTIKKTVKRIKPLERLYFGARRKLQVVTNLSQKRVVVCNFCASVFRKRGPVHSEYLMCPTCGASARIRVMYHIILDELRRRSSKQSYFFRGCEQLKGMRVLEFSPFPNQFRRRIYTETLGRYVASDFDLSAYRADIRLDLACDEDVAPHHGQFDIILCSHVLEHIPNYEAALRNLYRLLAPGGFLILQVPLLERQYVRVTWDEFHADNTRVYHRFGFDLKNTMDSIFSSTKMVVGQLDFQITSTEIDPGKYDFVRQRRNESMVLGEESMRLFGLGNPDLCDAFVAFRDG